MLKKPAEVKTINKKQKQNNEKSKTKKTSNPSRSSIW